MDYAAFQAEEENLILDQGQQPPEQRGPGLAGADLQAGVESGHERAAAPVAQGGPDALEQPLDELVHGIVVRLDVELDGLAEGEALQQSPGVCAGEMEAGFARAAAIVPGLDEVAAYLLGLIPGSRLVADVEVDPAAPLYLGQVSSAGAVVVAG